MTNPDTLTILLGMLGIAVTLGAIILTSLHRSEARLNKRIDALEANNEASETRLKEEIIASRERISAEIAASGERISAAIAASGARNSDDSVKR